MERRKLIIIGAAGRDFHNFNVRYRQDPSIEVVAFTAAQIPDIDGRKYPAELAGSLYPRGIPIYAESELPRLIQDLGVLECVFSYSDVTYAHVMALSAIVNAAGASFSLLGPRETQIKSTKPLIAVCAVRTGSGKSQTSRKIVQMLMAKGYKVAAIRHPMPYGDLKAQKVQRFATVKDLALHHCTIEEMEEYEPHIVRGNVIYSGVDYEAILRQAEQEADVILWDGGNNDFPFYVPDLLVTVADPLRAGHELSYYPGEVSLRMADAIIINKIDSAGPEDIQKLRENIETLNPKAMVIDAASPIRVDKPELIRGKKSTLRGRRPYPHPRHDAPGRWRCRRPEVPGRADSRSASLRGGEAGRNLRDLSRYRSPAARHGLWTGADRGPGKNHRRHRLRQRRRSDPHRPLEGGKNQKTPGEGGIRTSGNRQARFGRTLDGIHGPVLIKERGPPGTPGQPSLVGNAVYRLKYY